MLTCKNKGHLVSLLLAGALSANMESVSARTDKPVGNLEGGGALLSTGQVITPAAAPGSTFFLLSTGRRPETGGAEAA